MILSPSIAETSLDSVFVVFFPEKSHPSQAVPDYIKEIKDTYLLDDDEDEVVQDDRRDFRPQPPSFVPQPQPQPPIQPQVIRQTYQNSQPTVITSTLNQNVAGSVAPHGGHNVRVVVRQIDGTASNVEGRHSGTSASTSTSPVTSSNRQHRAVTNKIIFPSDRSDVIDVVGDVSDRRHYRSGRHPKVSVLPPLNSYYDDWIPLTGKGSE